MKECVRCVDPLAQTPAQTHQKRGNMEERIPTLLFLTVGGIGLVLAGTGIVILLLERRKKKNCEAITEGKIIKYKHNCGILSPVVEYRANGLTCKKMRRFRGVITVEKTGLLAAANSVEAMIRIDEKDIVHIRKGSYFNSREFAEERYPIGSYLKVFYNPKKPKQAYVEKIPEKPSLVGLLYCWIGLGIIAIGGILNFIAGI